ncbi:ATP-dependent helicase [Aerococcaceae bacterium DSM 111020]|nr:ATP-dependent helicase [Aerococcaceae bacterium DSM 111020]
MLSKVSPSSEALEKGIQNKIYEHVDLMESFVFNAGAGAGKTYSLVETLKYILKNHDSKLIENKQKIVCITYTNVAKDEILHEIGENELAEISTIHVFLWKIIKNQQKYLIKYHIENLKKELVDLKNKLKENRESKFFQDLEDKDQEKFKSLIFQDDFVEIFNTSYNLKASDFKENITSFFEIEDNSFDLDLFLTNVSYFKKTVGWLRKQDRYRLALDKIQTGHTDYKKVTYNSNYNRDILDRMIISHDTLLEYSNKLISESFWIKKIILDNFPIILVDEYQDTSIDVVESFNELDKFSSENKQEFLVGYFGDLIQNIYEAGIGQNLHKNHDNLKTIDKPYNRRSASEIIEKANIIRGQGVENPIYQRSIYEDSSGGTIDYHFISNDNELDDIIDQASRLDNTGTKACLLLRNKEIATHWKFREMYTVISKMPKYSGQNFENINTEFLSNNYQNMGFLFSEMLNLLEFLSMIENNKTPLSKVYSYIDNNYRNMTVPKTNEYIEKIKKIKKETLSDLIENLVRLASTYEYLEKSLKNIFSFEIKDTNDFKNFVIAFFRLDMEYEASEAKLEDFMNISFLELKNWYNYLTFEEDSQDERFIYRTLHGSKGTEYDTVVVVLTPGFGKKGKNFFTSFFENSDDEENQEARNLLYVAVTRAKKNLIFVFEDFDSEDQKNIKELLQLG